MATQNSSFQSAQNDVNPASGQVGEHATAPSNPLTIISALPKCMTPQPQSPLDPVCTHEKALRTTSDASKPKPARPTLDTRSMPPPPSEPTSQPTSPWLLSPGLFGRSRAGSVRAAPIGRLDETTVEVEVELSSEAAKKAENSLLWRYCK